MKFWLGWWSLTITMQIYVIENIRESEREFITSDKVKYNVTVKSN